MTTVEKIAIVALGGAIGALGRTGGTALVANLVGEAESGAIVGTLAVNLVGCFLMGMGRAGVAGGWGSSQIHAFAFSGCLGAFTTFSTFEENTVRLWREGRELYAGLYLSGSVLGGIVAFLVGWWLIAELS